MLTKEGPLLASQQGPYKPRLAVAHKMVQKLMRAHPVPTFDADGPSPSDAPRESWARAGKGSTDWLLKQGPTLASQQEAMPTSAKKPAHTDEKKQVVPKKAEAVQNAVKAPKNVQAKSAPKQQAVKAQPKAAAATN
jgi:hypothetical protein